LVTQEHIVVIDWGTSQFRAYLCKIINNKFTLIDQISSAGVCKSSKDYEQVFLSSIQPWAERFGSFNVLIAGQVGSSIGWKETPYIACPISPAQTALHCTHFTCQEHQLYIVPGLSCALPLDNFDVLRGEEVQILGWLESNSDNKKGEHLLCLPGTHTKWVHVIDGEVQLFKSAMTGELYDLLCNGSVLIQPQSATFSQEVFDLGAHFTLNSPLGNFAHGLFSVRSKQLFGQIPATNASAYLSGVLIGTDVRAAMNAEEWHLTQLNKVTIIGAEHLSECFARVLGFEQVNVQLLGVEQITLLGFENIYQQLKNQQLL
jgi:2-dehydro-3-deoxygalactonokinase